jgi:hypothetical protein
MKFLSWRRWGSGRGWRRVDTTHLAQVSPHLPITPATGRTLVVNIYISGIGELTSWHIIGG